MSRFSKNSCQLFLAHKGTRSFSILAAFVVMTTSCSSQKAIDQTGGSLIFKDDFNSLDTSVWISEIAPQPNSSVYVQNGNLVLDTKGGVTVWLNKKLNGNIRIEYTRKVIVDGGENDRLSDLNTFWMASDPDNKNLFTRKGVLEAYDSLQLYYAGMGGNTNSTTRFRKYQGTGERTLLKEFKDAAHLLKPNQAYKITIEVKGTLVRYAVDGETWFEFDDPVVLDEGYFGFRSTKSRQAITDISIYQLK
jgi:rhamnogalacturonan endolyase